MRGGRRGRGPYSNNVLDFMNKRSNSSQDTRCSQDRQYSTSGLPRLVLYGMQTEEQKRGRPGKEAKTLLTTSL